MIKAIGVVFGVVLCGLSATVVFASESLDTYYDVGDDADWGVYAAQSVAQTFTMIGTGNVPYIDVLGRRNNSFNTTCEISATSGGVPSGAALGTVTFNSSTWSASNDWNRITFASPVALTGGVKYALYCYTANAGSTIVFRTDSTSPSYAGGSLFYDATGGGSHSVWTERTVDDALFRVYVTDAAGATTNFATTTYLTSTSTALSALAKLQFWSIILFMGAVWFTILICRTFIS